MFVALIQGVERAYRATEGGRVLGTFTGRHLAEHGVAVTLEAEWRSAIVELESVTAAER